MKYFRPSRSPFLGLVASPLLAVGLLFAAVMEASSAEAPPTYTTDISIDEIMASIVMPSADILWTAVTSDMTADGLVETVPETDEDWLRVRNGAVTLAAITNALLIKELPIATVIPKEPAPGELGPEAIGKLRTDNMPAWAAHVTILHDVAMRAIGIIDKHDTAGLSEVGGDLDAACESCHLQFWYPGG